MSLDLFLKSKTPAVIITRCEACENDLSPQEQQNPIKFFGKTICVLCQLTILMNKEKIARIIQKKNNKESIIEEDELEEPIEEEDSDPF